MAIRLDPKGEDPQGLPVVGWEEDRNLFAPGGVSPARVSCFIRPDKDGVLQFVSVGLVRHGDNEEARPWDKLLSFKIERADELYYSAANRALIDVLATKSKSGTGRLLTTDGAYVIVANFGDERPSVPMHLNCAACAPVEATMLLDRLLVEFVGRRLDLIDARCDGKNVWPKARPFVAHAPAVTAAPPRRMVRLIDLAIAIVLGLIAWGLYRLLG